MSPARRVLIAVVALALVTATAYGVGRALSPADGDGRPVAAQGHRDASAAGSHRSPKAPRPSHSEGGSSAPSPSAEPTEEAEQPEPTDPTEQPEEPQLQPGPRLMGAGDDNDDVRDLQARLRQIAWFDHDVTGYYGEVTTTAVEGFQAKREIPVTGEVDRRTMDRLVAMTHEPTADELSNTSSDTSNAPGPLDPRCTSGEVLCIDKTTSTLRWVVDGDVETTLDVRFGAEYSPTREGAFSVDSKDRDHVSSLYGSAMPFSMFFSGGQAVHYSSDFAARGYAGASHGCVNVRDYDALAALYDQVEVGDPVIVYRS